jgi:hypothetical protein
LTGYQPLFHTNGFNTDVDIRDEIGSVHESKSKMIGGVMHDFFWIFIFPNFARFGFELGFKTDTTSFNHIE